VWDDAPLPVVSRASSPVSSIFIDATSPPAVGGKGGVLGGVGGGVAKGEPTNSFASPFGLLTKRTGIPCHSPTLRFLFNLVSSFFIIGSIDEVKVFIGLKDTDIYVRKQNCPI
jgi:hypothetical protein